MILFWQDYFDYCELDRLRGIFAQIDLTEVLREIVVTAMQRQTGLADRSHAASGIGHDRAAAPKRSRHFAAN